MALELGYAQKKPKRKKNDLGTGKGMWALMPRGPSGVEKVFVADAQNELPEGVRLNVEVDR